MFFTESIDLVFIGARVTFGFSELSGVVVVATKLEPASVLLFSKIVVVLEPESDGVLKSVADKVCIN